MSSKETNNNPELCLVKGQCLHLCWYTLINVCGQLTLWSSGLYFYISQELAESFVRVVPNRERKCSGSVGGEGE
jgi:hypothetical protein